MSSPRSEFTAGIAGNIIYVIGGFSGPNKLVANNIEICEVGKSWEILKVDMPVGYRILSSQSSCSDTSGNSVWILGGADGKRVYSNTYLLSIKDKKLIEKKSMNYPRGATICAYQDNAIYATLGFGSQRVTEVYDVKKDQWEIAQDDYGLVESLLDKDSAAINSEHVMSTKMAIMHKFL